MLGEGDGGNFVKSYNNLQHSVTKPKRGQFVTMEVKRDRPVSKIDSLTLIDRLSARHFALTFPLDVFCTSNDVLPQP